MAAPMFQRAVSQIKSRRRLQRLPARCVGSRLAPAFGGRFSFMRFISKFVLAGTAKRVLAA